ncbi:hypothetical protein FDX01_03130 [Citrobacter sp. wls613]|uniref:Uncharacterized protein n=1 Tax=Citrobacter gillenii TaxID=67828 RepID=A0ABD6M7I8_9ENTR|nr:hypothetical protein [Citrobacter gillenii]TKV24011.1 hypothetical protein FDX01_03130 [Citrobacter sp. wls613]
MPRTARGCSQQVWHSGYRRACTSMKHCFCYMIFVNYITSVRLFTSAGRSFYCLIAFIKLWL